MYIYISYYIIFFFFIFYYILGLIGHLLSKLCKNENNSDILLYHIYLLSKGK